MKELLIIIGVIIGLRIVFKIIRAVRRSVKYGKWIDNDHIELESRKGFREYRMTGMNYCDLGYRDLGYWEGHLDPQTSNPHDPNAIAVVRTDGKRIGWVSREQNRQLRETIGLHQVPAYGYLAMFTPDDGKGRKFYGCLMVKIPD